MTSILSQVGGHIPDSCFREEVHLAQEAGEEGQGDGTQGQVFIFLKPAQASPRHMQRLLIGPAWPWIGTLFLPFEMGLNWGCDRWLSGQSACHTSMRTGVPSSNSHIKTSQEGLTWAGKVAHWAKCLPHKPDNLSSIS